MKFSTLGGFFDWLELKTFDYQFQVDYSERDLLRVHTALVKDAEPV